jgi:glycosyltransferase involved in cell wall biosynthesis
MERRLKIIVIAHEFSPDQGSECAEGWNIVTRLVKYHDVTVIYATGSQFKHFAYLQSVNNYFKEKGLIPDLKLISVEQPKVTRIIAKINLFLFGKISAIGLPILYFIGYKHWQKRVKHKVNLLLEKEKFDIIHQLTQITFREPGYLWNLNIPFVWGPTGGTSNISYEFFLSYSLKSKLLEIVRMISNFYQFNFVWRIKNAIKKAKLIYVFSQDDLVRFNSKALGKVEIMLDAGTNILGTSLNISEHSDLSIINIIWCGQLVERKAPHIFLKAIALGGFDNQKVKFTIIGNGPLKTSLMNLANNLSLKNIEWISEVSQKEVLELMNKADFFVHTSIREATSNVIPEALSNGLPVICHDKYGMGIAINEQCGIKIPFISTKDSIEGFKQAITELVSNKVLLDSLKLGARKRANELSWDKMAFRIASDYYKILH